VSESQLQKPPFSAQYRLPSWASIDGAVFSNVEGNVNLISIVDSHTTITNVDPTGEVSEGFLIVKGVISEAKYHQTDVNEYYVWRGHGSLKMEVTMSVYGRQ
jgi:hypothetical protein